jgi:protein ImuB
MQLLSGMQDLGLQVQAACAPTATGAWLRAQGGDKAPAYSPRQPVAQLLDPLPLWVLEYARPHLETLSGIGCATLEQCRRLPRKGITRRFGNDLLRELDRAYGLEAEAHAWFEAPATFDAKLELLARVENAEALLFAARRLLLQLTGWLTARHTAVAGITLQLHHESSRHRDHCSTLVQLALGMPSRDVEHLTLLLRERLARLDLVAPVIEVSLHADQVVEQAAPNTELFPMPASDAESTERLVERLQSRLGPHAVQQLSLFADHRPECSMRITTYDGRRRPRAAVQDALPHSAGLRPAWLLKEPIALVTRQHKPFYQSSLQLLAGPERIEAGWWDDAPATRDYFVAQNERHMLLWIFRLRTIDETAGSGWFLHGFFA